MGRARVASIDPLRDHRGVGRARGREGAAAAERGRARIDVIGKLLFSVRDRLDPAFGDPPADDDLTLQESVAWEVYCVGRLGRLGHPVQRQRRLYQFRNRHGFTDAADAAFDRLWSAEDLTWADISAISAGSPRRPACVARAQFKSWARDRLEEVDLRAGRRAGRRSPRPS